MKTEQGYIEEQKIISTFDDNNQDLGFHGEYDIKFCFAFKIV